MAEWHAKELGIMLRSRRQALHLSGQQLADIAGVDRGTIEQLERGQRNNPSASTLHSIADALGLPLGDLLDAASPTTQATSLPALTPYLRTKYPQLPPHAVDELGHFFDYLQARYGEHRAAEGDDER